WTLLKQPQMVVICFSRIAEPFSNASRLSYLLFQLRYLSPGASEVEIATHAGLLVAAKTSVKVGTGILWGRLADSKGRKLVMLISSLSSCVANVGYGFSTTFALAMFWQIVQGGMNSNIAMARTVVAELHLNSDERLRARALLLLQLSSNIGMVFGPLIGGFASNRERLGLFSDYPYALPNLISGAFFAISALGILLVVEETLESAKSCEGSRFSLWNTVTKVLHFRRRGVPAYEALPQEDRRDSLSGPAESSLEVIENGEEPETPAQPSKLPFRKIWTREITCNLISLFIISGHISTFNTVWTLFLGTSVAKDAGSGNPFVFGGGVGLDAPKIGTLITCATAVGVALQMFALPRLIDRFGTLRLWRLCLWFFPVAYFFAPFAASVASAVSRGSNPESGDAAAASGSSLAVWVVISVIMVLFVVGRTIAQPLLVILLNECVPHPAARATVNSLSTSVANAARSLFPLVLMAIYGYGLRNGFVAAAFWLICILALTAIVASRWIGTG
ncbi:major facilitator superfamily domain-containing protein, partial [Xylariales sp. PMI_506]